MQKKMPIIFCLTFMYFYSYCQDSTFEVDGILDGNYNEQIHLFYENQFKKNEKISSEVKNGKFHFHGQIKQPTFTRIFLDQPSMVPDFYLEGGKIFLNCKVSYIPQGTDTMKNLKILDVKGSQTETEKNKFHNYLNDILLTTKSVEEKNRIYRQKIKEFIATNPKNKLGGFFIFDLTLKNCDAKLNSEQANELYNMLDSSVILSLEGKEAESLVQALYTEETNRIPSSQFHDFSLRDEHNKVYNLQSFKGKYLLIVFWASWCGPCRKEHPELNALYDQYKNHNFDMLGISIDEMKNKNKWIDAIHKDKLTWKQVSDLKGTNGDLAKFYLINKIPVSFLLDPNGKIVSIMDDIKDIKNILQKELK